MAVQAERGGGLPIQCIVQINQFAQSSAQIRVDALLATNARKDLGCFTRPGAWLGKVLTCPVEPLYHIGDISPRPVFMLNGTEDLGIPESNSRLLYQAAKEPKTLRWIDAGHVVLQDQQFHDLVSQELVTWLTEEGFVGPESFE